MYCVKSKRIIEDTIKKSRFIGIVVPCHSENEAQQQLNFLHQQHPNASHVVFAYRIKSSKGIIMRFYDAGEPSGTAGKPVYQHLEGKDLINVLCVVIRYFGGIKLGAGGLTRAYCNAAKNVLTNDNIIEHIEYAEFKIELEYKQMQHFEYQLEKLEGMILKKSFSENISLMIKIPNNHLSLLAEKFKFDISQE